MVIPWSTTEVECDGASANPEPVPDGASASGRSENLQEKDAVSYKNPVEKQTTVAPFKQDVIDGAACYLVNVPFGSNTRLEQQQRMRSRSTDTIDAGTISLHELLVQSPEEMLCCQDKDGDNELTIAIIKRHNTYAVFIIEVLVSRRKTKLLDIRNSLGQAALHLAVKTNAVDVTKALVAADATLDLRDNEGYTPLHCACAKGLVNQVLILTSKPEHRPLHKECAELMDYKGWNCIHIATMGSYTEVIEVLVKQVGADVNKRGGSRGMTALHYAVMLQDITMMLFLLHIAKADVTAVTYDNWSPLELALGFGYNHLVQPLLIHGASNGDVINFQNKLAMLEENTMDEDELEWNY